MNIQNIPLYLAPLAGISETIFRKLNIKHGADSVITEMVSAEGLLRNSANTKELLTFSESERPLGVQLFGCDPERLALACAWLEEHTKPDYINLNSGCPVHKVVSKNGGAALLKDPVHFENIVSAMVKATTLPVTVKIRSGWHTNVWVDVEFAKIAEGCGAASVMLHPRSKTMGYTGHSFWDRIALVKQAVSIPVIGNGDIVTADDAVRMIRETNCDGLMIGRGSFGNPWLFGQIKAALAGNEVVLPTLLEKCETICAHIAAYRDHAGERLASKEMRKHIAWYLHGMKGASHFRDKVFRAENTEVLEQVVREAFTDSE